MLEESRKEGERKGLSNGPKPSGTYRHFVVHLDENREGDSPLDQRATVGN